MSAQVLFHPIDFCTLVKRKREKLRVLPLVVILVLVAVCQVAFVYFTHYPLNQTLPDETVLWQQLLVLYLPVLSWVVGAYSTTTLMNGEVKFTELLTAGIYGYIPYIVTTPILLGVSHLLTTGTAVYGVLNGVVVAWMVLLQFLFFMMLNDYGFLKSLWVAFVSLIAVILIWAVILLFFVFIYQVVVFVKDLIVEIRYHSMM